jgi:hypothetical protein
MLHRLLILVLLCAVFGQASAQQSHNLVLLKKDTQILERIVHEILKQNFPDPFALTAEPRGAYLQGYGVTLSFQLNINRAKIRTLFGEMTAPKSMGQKTKDQQLHLLKDIMIQCLADYGLTVKQLAPHDRITIQAHVQDRNELDPAKNNTVIVLTASKDDINLLATRRLTDDQFKERVHILEY